MRRSIDRAVTAMVPLAWLILIPFAIWWPAGWWYSLDAVVVTDEYRDGSRVLDIDRTIHRAFTGHWRVFEELRTRDGYVTVEVCEGDQRYRPDKAMPDPPTMDWWKGRDCRLEGGWRLLPAGTYRLCTLVTIHPDNFPKKHVERCSPDYVRAAHELR